MNDLASITLIGLTILVAGCAAPPPAPAQPMASACPGSSPCAAPATYEVTWDAWCADRCSAYPVSHRSPTLACGENRVEYRGGRAASACTTR